MRRRGLLAGAVLAIAAFGGPADLVSAQTRRPNPPAPTTPTTPPGPAPIDLNSASRDDLMRLEGIGEVRADAIIRARPFKAKTELVERHIIPEALYDRINARITVRSVPMPAPAPPAPRH